MGRRALPPEIYSKIIRHLYESVYPNTHLFLRLTLVSRLFRSIVLLEIYRCVEVFGVRSCAHFYRLLRTRPEICQEILSLRVFADEKEPRHAQGRPFLKLIGAMGSLTRIKEVEIFMDLSMHSPDLIINFAESAKLTLSTLRLTVSERVLRRSYGVTRTNFGFPSRDISTLSLVPSLHELTNLKSLYLENLALEEPPPEIPKWKLNYLTLIFTVENDQDDTWISSIDSWFRSSFESMKQITLSRVPFEFFQKSYWDFLSHFKRATVHIWNGNCRRAIEDFQMADLAFTDHRIRAVTDLGSPQLAGNDFSNSFAHIMGLSGFDGLKQVEMSNMLLFPPLADTSFLKLESLRLNLFLFRDISRYFNLCAQWAHTLKSLSLQFKHPNIYFSEKDTKSLLHIFRDTLERLELDQISDSAEGRSAILSGYFELETFTKIKAFKFTSLGYVVPLHATLFPPNVLLLYLSPAHPCIPQGSTNDSYPYESFSQTLKDLRVILFKSSFKRLGISNVPPGLIGSTRNRALDLSIGGESMAIERIQTEKDTSILEIESFQRIREEGKKVEILVWTFCDHWLWEYWCQRMLT